MQFRASSGSLNWFKKNPELTQISKLECLDGNNGVIGCGYYVGTIHVFNIASNGDQNYVY
jgi:hypothetical protein